MADSEVPNGDKTRIIEEETKMDDRTSKIIIVCVAIANVVALVAIILSFVGVSKTGSNEYYINGDGGGSGGVSVSGGSNSDKIWMLHIGHFGANTQYLDEATGTIRGYDVDVVNAVCQVANKNCRLVWDLYERCWDHQVGERPRGGQGLMGSWYDGCVGWYNTLDRSRTYMFTKPIEKSYPIGFFVKKGTRFTWPNFTNLKIGFLDGWWIDEQCLTRYEPTGYDQNDEDQVIHVSSDEAAADDLVSGKIHILFAAEQTFLLEHSELELVYTPATDKCANAGPGIMVQKDENELVTWWNTAFDSLIATNQYTAICDNLNKEHGNQPGNEPEDICVV